MKKNAGLRKYAMLSLVLILLTANLAAAQQENLDKKAEDNPQLLNDPNFLSSYLSGSDLGGGDNSALVSSRMEKARKHFEQPGNLAGEGAQVYLRARTNGNVQFLFGNAQGLKASGNTLYNVAGSPILDINQFPSGTLIRPNGQNGFIVTLLGKPDFTISGGNVNTPVAYEGQNIKIGQQSNLVTIAGGSANSVAITDEGIFNVELSSGKKVKIRADSPFKITNDGVSLQAKTDSSFLHELKWNNLRTFGETTLTFKEQGYRIEGDFYHEMDTSLGKVAVPTLAESLVSEAGIAKNKAIACFKCGDKLENDMVVWDGKKIIASGKVGLSIEKNDEVMFAKGLANNIEYEIDANGINMVKKPPVDDVRPELLASLLKQKDDYQQRLKEIDGKISNGAIGQELERLQNTRIILEKRVWELPSPVSDSDESVKDKFEYMGKNYDIRALSGHKAGLLSTSIVRGNDMYVALLNEKMQPFGTSDPSLEVHKLSLASNSLQQSENVPEIKPLQFSVNAHNAEWDIKNDQIVSKGTIYNSYMDFDTRTKVLMSDNEIRIASDVSKVAANAAPVGVDILVGKALSGKYLDALSVKVGENRIEILNDFESNRGKIESTSSYFDKALKETLDLSIQTGKFLGVTGANTLTDVMEETAATKMKEEVLLRKDSDIQAVTNAVRSMVQQQIIPDETGKGIIEGIQRSSQQLKETQFMSDLLRYRSSRAVIEQKTPDTATVTFYIEGIIGEKQQDSSGKQIITTGPVKEQVIGPLEINTNGRDIAREAKERLAAISRLSMMDIYRNFAAK